MLYNKSLIKLMVRAEGLEPPRVSPSEPKSDASTNFATPAFLAFSDKIYKITLQDKLKIIKLQAFFKNIAQKTQRRFIFSIFFVISVFRGIFVTSEFSC